jgi:diketogulonate reductase-like aldo/keto reductase
MNPYVREKQIDTLKYCVKHNIVVEGYSPLASVQPLAPSLHTV